MNRQSVRFTPFSLNVGGRLIEYSRPAVMGIVNVTPDSFYAGSRTADAGAVGRRVAAMLDEGVDIIDVGAYSSRPGGAADVSPEEESERLARGLEALRRVAPDAVVSVDTFRASVARKAVSDFGPLIINDISGGALDDDMFETVAELGVPYIMMHMRGTPADRQEHCDYDNLVADILAELGERLGRLTLMGVNDIIVDPGFGFSKTLEQNYELLESLPLFALFHRPLLVGLSRKSMATRLLGIDTAEALNATTVLNTLALDRGASVLRVHDVAAARQAVDLYMATTDSCKLNH